MSLKSVFRPAAQQASQHLMIVLHGLGDSVAGFEWMPAMLRLEDMNYLLVNAPDVYYAGFSWYDFAGNPQPGVERSRRLLFDLLDAQRAVGFPTDQTVLFGFSQGCLMTIDVGFRYPHRLAGLVGVSGYVFEPEELLKNLGPVARQQRMLFTHGTQDPMIPCAAVHEQVTVLQQAGLKIQWRAFNKAHTIAGAEEVKVIRDFVVDCYRTPR